MTQTSVIIAGAGPAGLMSALLLARRNLQVTLIERHATTSVHPKARGLNIRTMEILRGLGLEPAVRQAGSKLARSRFMLQVESLAGRELQRFEDEDLMITGETLGGYTPCQWVQCAQSDLEALLAQEAIQAGANLRFGCELTRFDQNPTGVVCDVRDLQSGDGFTIQADYLLGCDGANSFVRRTLGIPLDGRGAMEHFVNVHFRADLRPLVEGRWFGICFVENPAVQGLFLPVDNEDQWLFNMPFDPQKTDPASLNEGTLKSKIRAAVGLESLEPEILSVLPWVASALVAPRMRDRRVFLLGDAAHIMPPSGAFGLNTAMQDAHNLAWKIAAAPQSEATGDLLDSYEQERLPIARTVVRYSAQEMDSPQPWEHGDDRPTHGTDESPNDRRGPWEQSLEQQLQAVIGFQYFSVAVAPGPPLHGLSFEGQPGTRFPHFWLDDGRSSLDLLPDSFAIVTHMAPSGTRCQDLPVVAVDPAVWERLAGQSHSDAFLVRPDGIVCARGTLAGVMEFYDRLFCPANASRR